MEKYGFVYIWHDRKHRRYYIGSHWGNIDDGYVCSSRWMRKSFKRRPQDFKRRILERISTTRAHLLEREGLWLALIKDTELSTRYYNHTKSVKNPWWAYPEKTTRVSNKIRQHNAEHGHPWSGRKHSEETKAKMRASAKTRKSTPRRGMKWNEAAKLRVTGRKGANAGKQFSEEHRAKLRIASLGNKSHSGHKHSEETRRKMQAAWTIRKAKQEVSL